MLFDEAYHLLLYISICYPNYELSFVVVAKSSQCLYNSAPRFTELLILVRLNEVTGRAVQTSNWLLMLPCLLVFGWYHRHCTC